MDKERYNKLLNELTDARRRRELLRLRAIEASDKFERNIWNQSINIVKKTIKRLKKELNNIQTGSY
jgi:hypothetical protein